MLLWSAWSTRIGLAHLHSILVSSFLCRPYEEWRGSVKIYCFSLDSKIVFITWEDKCQRCGSASLQGCVGHSPALQISYITAVGCSGRPCHKGKCGCWNSPAVSLRKAGWGKLSPCALPGAHSLQSAWASSPKVPVLTRQNTVLYMKVKVSNCLAASPDSINSAGA